MTSSQGLQKRCSQEISFTTVNQMSLLCSHQNNSLRSDFLFIFDLQKLQELAQKYSNVHIVTLGKTKRKEIM